MYGQILRAIIQGTEVSEISFRGEFMLNENIINEMTQRSGEKTASFMSRQQMARNVIRKINALEIRLVHLMSDEEYVGKIGDSINRREAKIL